MLDAEPSTTPAHNATVHRGAHLLAEEATDAYEGARAKVAAFIGADAGRDRLHQERHRGAQPGRLRVGQRRHGRAGGSRSGVGPGDEIVDHRDGAPREYRAVAGAVPAHRRDAALVRLTDDGRLDLSDLDDADQRAHQGRRVHPPVQHASARSTRSRGSSRAAHEVGALVVVDACQSVPHLPVDVPQLGADFVAFTGHKMLGPTGIGVLWGRRELLEALPPFLTGGAMIETVPMEGSTYAPPPHRFEAGTPPIAAGGRRWARPCDYLAALGMDAVAAHEQALTAHALDGLAAIPGVRIIGPTTTERPRRRGLVRRRRRPPARRRPGARRRRASRCGSATTARGRCTAAFGVAGHRPARRFCALHHPAEVDALVDGAADASGASSGWQVTAMMQLESLYQEIILDHYRHPHHRVCASRSTPRCTTSTRPAATRSPCGCT